MFIFGKLDGKIVSKSEDKDGHILVVGSSGSGKSSCIAIPSLRAWKKRVFAIDIKGELYQHTHEYRPNIKVFDPLNPATFGYDPFYTLNTPNQAQEAQAISLSLVPLPPNTTHTFWIQSAQNMLTGFILHYYNEGLSFIDTIKAIQSKPVGEQIRHICTNSKTDSAKIFLNTFDFMESKTLYEIYAELSRHIIMFATDINIIEAFSRTEKITPEDLESDKDIYIILPQHLLDQWETLLNLIIRQFLRHFEQRTENATPILFLLDEFPRLGKLEKIENGLATLRANKITICLMIQNLAQLDLTYGKEARQVILGNCDYEAVLNATDVDAQEYYSRLLGTGEKGKFSTSRHYTPGQFFSTRGSNFTTEEKRKIKPENFARLGKIALFTPYGFMLVEKAPYYIN